MPNLNQLKLLIKQKALLQGKFVLASGKESNIYFDLSKVTSEAVGIQLISSILVQNLDLNSFDAVGGPAYGAMPIIYGLLSISNNSHLRAFYYRKEKKEYGNQELLEGNLKLGDKVVLLEDVVTTGKSLLNVAKQVQSLGCTVVEAISILERDEAAGELFNRNGIPYRTIVKASEL